MMMRVNTVYWLCACQQTNCCPFDADVECSADGPEQVNEEDEKTDDCLTPLTVEGDFPTFPASN